MTPPPYRPRQRRGAAPRVAGAGRHRRAVPGRPAAEAGLAAGHAAARTPTGSPPEATPSRRSSRPGRRWDRRPRRRGRARPRTATPATPGWRSCCATSSAGASLPTTWRAAGRAGVRRTRPTTRSPSQPTGALVHGDGDRRAGAWSSTRSDSLRDAADDGWAASPIDRMEALLRSGGVPIGVVTDGRWWAIVSARRGQRWSASGIVDAQTWIEEPRPATPSSPSCAAAARRRRTRASGCPSCSSESVAAAEEITEALGVQVRRAVELLVQAFSEAAADARAPRRARPAPGRPRRDLRGRRHGDDAGRVPALRRGARPAAAEPSCSTMGYGISDELDALRPAGSARSAGGPRRHLPHLAPAARHLARPSTAARRSRTCGCRPTAARCSTPTASRSSPPHRARHARASRVSDRVMLHVLRVGADGRAHGRAGPADLVPRHRRRADRLHLRGPARLLLRRRRPRSPSA